METSLAPNVNSTAPAAPAVSSVALLSIARHVLSVLIGMLVLKGYVNASWSPFILSGVLALVVVAAKVFEHSAYAAKFQAALAFIPPDVLADAIAQFSGSTPQNETTPKTVLPAQVLNPGVGTGGGVASLLLAVGLTLACSMLLTCCAAYLAKPDTQKALQAVEGTAVSYALGNDLGAGVDAISAASYFVRSLQGTPAAADAASIVHAVKTGGASGKLAAHVAASVGTLVTGGASADDANETIAEKLDDAVQMLTPSAPDARSVEWKMANGRWKIPWRPWRSLRETPALLSPALLRGALWFALPEPTLPEVPGASMLWRNRLPDLRFEEGADAHPLVILADL